MFPIKSLSKSLLLFTLVMNSFFVLSSPGFADGRSGRIHGLSQTTTLARSPLHAKPAPVIGELPPIPQMIHFTGQALDASAGVVEGHRLGSTQSKTFIERASEIGKTVARNTLLGTGIGLGAVALTSAAPSVPMPISIIF